jgi:hypothetical protein
MSSSSHRQHETSAGGPSSASARCAMSTGASCARVDGVDEPPRSAARRRRPLSRDTLGAVAVDVATVILLPEVEGASLLPQKHGDRSQGMRVGHHEQGEVCEGERTVGYLKALGVHRTEGARNNSVSLK